MPREFRVAEKVETLLLILLDFGDIQSFASSSAKGALPRDQQYRGLFLTLRGKGATLEEAPLQGSMPV